MSDLMPDFTVDSSKSILMRQYDWPPIAKDIAMLTVPTDGASAFSASDIAEHYDISSDDFVKLLKLPAFRTLVEAELTRIKDLGPMAGARLRAESMASVLQERVFRDAMAGVLDNDQVIRFLDMLNKTAGIDRAPEQVAAAAPKSTVNIAFNIPKLPHNRKLAHLYSNPENHVIEVAEE